MSPDRRQIALAAVLIMVMSIGSTLTGATENASPVDPAGGFKALEIGAMRLSDEQKKRLTIVAARHVEAFYPDKALAQGLSGRAVLDVVIEADGSVSDVRLLEEDPQQAGFGDAAIKAASRYRYRNTFERRVVRTLTLAFATPGPAAH